MFRLAFITLVAAASASVIHENACPDLKAVENFNLTAYQGVWYEISKLPTEAEKDGKCGSAEYTLDGNVVKVKNTHVVKGIQTFIEGTAKLAENANNSAKLIVTFKFGDVTRDTPLSVLATDYNNYAFAYNCKYDEKKKSHQDYAWVLSRTKTLDGEPRKAVDDFLKLHAKEIDESKFVNTDFSEEACKFTGTSLITESPRA